VNIIGLYTNVNASACLLKSGQIVAVGEEERFNRIKANWTKSLPIQSIKYVLSEGHMTLDDIDYIAIGWDLNKYPDFMNSYVNKNLQGRSEIDKIIHDVNISHWNPDYFKFRLEISLSKAGVKGKMPEIRFLNHHLTHAASTFYLSPFSEATVITVDGSGEENATCVWKGSGDFLEKIHEINVPNSLGWFYSAITEYIGFKAYSGEGKTMGLAPYGNDVKEIREALEKIIQIEGHNYTIDPSYIYFSDRTHSFKFTDKLVRLLGQPPRKHGEEFTQFHKDVAFVTQDLLEEAVTNIVNYGVKETGFRNVCVAGGVGMNCKMNGKIQNMEEVDDVFVIPPSSDNGTSIGAALALYAEEGYGCRDYELEHVYYGPKYKPSEIEKILRYTKVPHVLCQDAERKAAELIYENNIVAWYQGAMEIGSRALGNRSILANPLNQNMKDKINHDVKHREAFRPFCPSMLEEDAPFYLDGIKSAPYMIVAYDALPGIKELLPSVVHHDNSVRPQTVTEDSNWRYWNLINEFKKLSGHGVVLNTSFNIAGEPIVCTPQEAIRCFYGTGIDYLFIGDYMIAKKWGRGI
tara:strand:- start:8 stop:1738 length:1731 start_codon:yes stop_codon:yes gene_type:complete